MIPLFAITYDCPSCELNIDRDLNAALNLKRYGISRLKST